MSEQKSLAIAPSEAKTLFADLHDVPVIALAVSEGHISAADAFEAAQLDELFQIERWGADPIAIQRHDGIRRDLEAAARFLALLGDARLKG